MLHIRHPSTLQASIFEHRAQGDSIAFVPTMGALHQGHLSLVKRARTYADTVIVSVFVNPLQFNADADLNAYPRTEKQDAAKCRRAGVDIFFCPNVNALYPDGFQTTVKAGALARGYEGRHRPGHFDGMLTVVLKLLNLTAPHVAIFGEKDFQQLRLVQQMVRDFHVATEIVASPTARERDGLAKSSRNARLTAANRKRAPGISRVLRQTQAAVAGGERKVAPLLRAARETLAAIPQFTPEYCDIVDPTTLKKARSLSRPGRMLVAGTFKQRVAVRLLDNVALIPPRAQK